MPISSLAHVTLTEVPTGMLLFVAGLILGGAVVLALRKVRTR